MAILVKKTKDLEKKIDESQFAQPSSKLEVYLVNEINNFYKSIQKKYKGNIDQLIIDYYQSTEISKKFTSEEDYMDVLTNIFYNKNAHNGSDEIRNDKFRLMRKYEQNIFKHGISPDKDDFLKKQLKKAYKNIEIKTKIDYLWCEYPNPNESFAAQYELNLKKIINKAMSRTYKIERHGNQHYLLLRAA